MKKGSGEHSAVQAFRAKLDSITETTLPLAKKLNERIERARRINATATGKHKPFRGEPPPAPAAPTAPAKEEDGSTPAIAIDLDELDE